MSARTYGERSGPLRRPNKSAVEKLANMEQSNSNILSLFKQISELRSNQQDITKCLVIFDKLSPTDDSAVVVVRQLHAQLLSEGSAIKCRSMAIFLSEFIKERGPFIRSLFLPLIQENFEKRNELMSQKTAFLNAVQFHGEIYNLLLVANHPLHVLLEPLIQYMMMLVNSATNADLRILILQLVINGKKMKEHGGEAYASLLVEIRKMAIHKPSNELLLAIDITSDIFPHSPGSALYDYYQATLPGLYREVECEYWGTPRSGTTTPITAFGPSPDLLYSSTPMEEIRQERVHQAFEESSDEKLKQSIGILTDPNAVRERMRSKGLLSKKPLQTVNGTLQNDFKENEGFGGHLPGLSVRRS